MEKKIFQGEETGCVKVLLVKKFTFHFRRKEKAEVQTERGMRI